MVFFNLRIKLVGDRDNDNHLFFHLPVKMVVSHSKFCTAKQSF